VDIVTGQQVESFQPIDGSVKQKIDDSSRWQMDITFIDDQDRPLSEMQDMISPVRCKMIPYRGIELASGGTELVPCGEFYIRKRNHSYDTSGAPTWRIQAFDVSIRCQTNLTEPFYINPGSQLNATVINLLSKKRPNLQFQLASSEFTVPGLLYQEDIDPWGEATKLMVSHGLDLYQNRLGACASASRKLIPQASVWNFTEGVNMWNVDRESGDDNFPNVVVVKGDNPGASGVSGLAADMDPHSLTYRYGDYGQQVYTFRSEKVTTNAQANAMASYLLARMLGGQDVVTFEALPNAALDVGDTVTVTSERLGLYHSKLLVSELEIPLTVQEPMKVTCRRSIFTSTDEVQSQQVVEGAA